MRASRRSPSAGIRLIGVADRYFDADVGGTERVRRQVQAVASGILGIVR
jgi:hypothetical protein